MANFNSKIAINRSQPIYVGIDVHKRTWSICLVHCGETLGRFTLPSHFERKTFYLPV